MRQKQSDNLSIEQLVCDIETLADRMETTRPRAFGSRRDPRQDDAQSSINRDRMNSVLRSGDDAARADIEGAASRRPSPAPAPQAQPAAPQTHKTAEPNRAERLRLKLGSLARTVETMSQSRDSRKRDSAATPRTDASLRDLRQDTHARPGEPLDGGMSRNEPRQDTPSRAGIRLSPQLSRAQPPGKTAKKTARPVNLTQTLKRISDDQRKNAPAPFSSQQLDETITKHFESLAGQIEGLLKAPKEKDPVGEKLMGAVGELRSHLVEMPARTDALMRNKFDTVLERLDRFVDRDDLQNVHSQLDKIRTQLEKEPVHSDLDRKFDHLSQTLSNQIAMAARPVEKILEQFSTVEERLTQISNTDRFDQLEWRLDSMLEQIKTIEQSSGNRTSGQSDLLNMLEVELQALTKAISHSSLNDRFDQLEDQIDKMAADLAGGSGQHDLSLVTDQLDRITADVNAVHNLADSGRIEAALSTIETRLADLSSEMGTLSQQSSTSADHVVRLMDKMDQVAAQAPDSQIFVDLDKQITALTKGLETSGGADMARLAEEIHTLSSRIDQAASKGLDAAAIEQLDERVNDLADLIAAMSSQKAMPQDDLIDGIRETVTSALTAAPSQPVNETLLEQLQSDVQALITRTSKPEPSTQQALEQMHVLLERLVTRVDALDRQTVDAVTAPVDTRAPSPAPKTDEPLDDFESRMTLKSAPKAQISEPAALKDQEPDLRRHMGHDLPEPADADLDGMNKGLGAKDNTLLAPGQRPDFNRLDDPIKTDTAAFEDEPQDQRTNFIAAARRAAQTATDSEQDARAKRAVRSVGADTLRARMSAISDDDALPDMDDADAIKATKSRKRILILAIATIVLGVSTLAIGQLKPGGLLNSTPAPIEEPAQIEPTPSAPIESAPQNSVEPEVTGSIDRQQIVPGSYTDSGALPEHYPVKEITYAEPDPAARPFEPGTALTTTADPSSIEQTRFEPTAEIAAQSFAEVGPTVAMPPLEIGSERLRLAAASGDPIAQFEVAARFTHGEGVIQDMTQAAIWYEHAARNGLAPAQYRLGSLYEKGDGVPRDAKQAVRWYTSAAEQGNTKAMHNLAVLYAGGGLGKADFDNAIRWFSEAANHGIRDSQYNLGILYFKGLGVERDSSESYLWFALAAQQGDRDSASKRDKVAAALKPEQLRDVETRIALWKPRKAPDLANVVLQPEDGWSDAFPITVGDVTPQPNEAAPDQADQISQAQNLLTSLGYQAGPADGVMGPKTREAIATFQRTIGLPVTGQVDQALVTALVDQIQ